MIQRKAARFDYFARNSSVTSFTWEIELDNSRK